MTTDALHRPQFLADLLITALERNADRPALYLGDVVLTGGQMRDQISRFSQALAARGIGKGSTVAMIRAGLEAMGGRVHVYTSPHLARFHERIRLAGTLISEPALTALLDECYAQNGGAPITFFEITTCAAFLAFARTPADYTLLEVGLGGRLDATNVIDRPAATITMV